MLDDNNNRSIKTRSVGSLRQVFNSMRWRDPAGINETRDIRWETSLAPVYYVYQVAITRTIVWSCFHAIFQIERLLWDFEIQILRLRYQKLIEWKWQDRRHRNLPCGCHTCNNARRYFLRKYNWCLWFDVRSFVHFYIVTAFTGDVSN